MLLQSDVGFETASAQVRFRPIFQQQVLELQPASSTGRTIKKKSVIDRRFSQSPSNILNGVTPFQMLSMASFPCGCTIDSGCAPSGASLKQKDLSRSEKTKRKTCPGCSRGFAKLLLHISGGRSPVVIEPRLTSTLRRQTSRRASPEITVH